MVSGWKTQNLSVDVGVELSQDVYLERGVVLRGKVCIESDVTIGAHSVVIDSSIKKGAIVRPMSHLEGCEVGEDAIIGPFARLRRKPDWEKVKIGNFVETKKASLHPVQSQSPLTLVTVQLVKRQILGRNHYLYR